MNPVKPLPAEALHHACDLAAAGIASADQIEPLDAPLGQERALAAIELGVGMPHEGYNLYLMGSVGLGKHALIDRTLEQHHRNVPAPSDWCYVADFGAPSRATALGVPAGRGRHLRADMHQLVDDLMTAVPAAFQSQDYNARAEAIQQEFKAREDAASGEMARRASELGIALIHTPSGFTMAPARDGEIMGPEEFNALPQEEKQRISGVIDDLRRDLRAALAEIPSWQREMRRRFKELDRATMETMVAALMAELESAYTDLPDVLDYLGAVKRDLIENGEGFRQVEGDGSKTPRPDDAAFTRYRVNLLVDNADRDGAPIVYEDNPTYVNLVGRVEHIARFGTLTTDFTLVKPGALHRANGGFLVLDALRLFASPFAWDALKRVLRSREIRIESLERTLSLAGTTSLEPESIPLDLKVILVGDRLLYYLLNAYDPDFRGLFKVAADFSEELPRSPANDLLYSRFVVALGARERLLPLELRALERVIEESARRANDGERLSLHLGDLSDLLRESDHVARRAAAEAIERTHVQVVIDAQRRRLDQLREHIQQDIVRGTLLIDTDGVQLGRVNGLSVMQLGNHTFGAPVRISATARLGNGEVVDIQREVDQAGPIHAKGVFILAAYLGRRYARFQPLCLSASLVFEQTYGSVEGDSASLAELCALLSAIADLPIRQSLAVTGSVNQHGEVQAIGGINEKIEGFFDVCAARGLTGEQGVIIPKSNRKHLMLRHDVVEAAGQGRFGIYAVGHADQAMELLTGQPAGVPDQQGAYPPGSVNGQLQQRLAELYLIRQQISMTGRE